MSKPKREFPTLDKTITDLWETEYRKKIEEKMLAMGITPCLVLTRKDDTYHIEHESEEFDKIIVARFACQPMSGCHAIVLLHFAAVSDFLRGNGIGTILHDMRLEAARLSGFAFAQCTTIKTNDVQNTILSKRGWERVKEFLNVKTGNTVVYWMKAIPQKEEEK